MKKALALILGRRAGQLQIPANGQEFPVNPNIGMWIDVDDDVTEATHRHVNGVVEVIPPPDPPTVAQQIRDLEATITARMVREVLLASPATFPPGSPHAGQTAAQAIADIDAQIVALRSQ
jgi:hypothetical protein